MPVWYVATLRPGATRQAKPRLITPPDRKDETLVEQSLRDAGYEAYLPKMRKEVRHHRSKKLIVREFPLFTGYVFVCDPDQRGGIRDCDGVGSLLGHGGTPWPIPDAQVRALQASEEAMIFDDTREARIRRKQEGRTRRETVEMRFPTGAQVRPKEGHKFAGFHTQVESITGRGSVVGLIQLFGRLVPVEFDAEDLERLAA